MRRSAAVVALSVVSCASHVALCDAGKELQLRTSFLLLHSTHPINQSLIDHCLSQKKTLIIISFLGFV